MNFLVIASLVVAITLLLGALLAVLMAGLDRAVKNERVSAREKLENYNPSVTLGYDLPVSGDYQEQLKQAKKLAAIQAANTPRGGNRGIGTLGNKNQPTAIEAAKSDPVTAVNIARFHGWNGAREGVTAPTPADVVAKAPSETVAPEKSAADLVPGVDYPVIEITDDMPPAEIRKARIANAKAKSAAAKELKAAGPQIVEPTAAAGQVPTRDAEPAGPDSGQAISAAASQGGAPVAGVDYPVIEFTEDMTPEEKRKARITNAKAKSAAMKEYKASGGSIAAVPAGAVSEAPAPSETAAEPTVERAPPSGIPQPNLIEITDDMMPEEIRKARIQNAKEKSAYKRALKAAGVDPASVS
jgi:hypothetical protein